MAFRESFVTVLVSSLTIVLVVAQMKRVSGLYIRQIDKRSVAVCQDHSLVADRCSAWKELDFCVNHQREMQFVCKKTCNYCVPGEWAAKRIWGEIQVPDNAMDGPRFTESKNKTKKPFVQIMGKQDLDAAASAIVDELESEGKEQQRPKARPNSRPLAVEIMGRVQKNNESTEGKDEQKKSSSQNETRSNKLSLAEATSRRIINQLLSSHENEAKSKHTNMQPDLSKLLQLSVISSEELQENNLTLPSTTPTTPPSRSRFELNTTSGKIPFYLYENTEEKGRKDEKEKIKEASAAIKNVLKLFKQRKKTAFHRGRKTGINTGVGMVEQFLNDIVASRTIAREDVSEKAVNRGKTRPLGNGDGLASDDSATWKMLARKLALQLQRVVRHMRLREIAQEHEKAALREQMINMMKHEDDEEDADDEDDEAANMKRVLGFGGSRKKATRDSREESSN